MPDWLTKQEAADHMGIALADVDKALLESPPLPHYRKGPHVRFKAAELDAYVERMFSAEFNPDTDSDGGWVHVSAEGPPPAEGQDAPREIAWDEKTTKTAVIVDASGKPYEQPAKTGPIAVREPLRDSFGQVIPDAQFGAEAAMAEWGLDGTFGVKDFDSPAIQNMLGSGVGSGSIVRQMDLRPEKEHEGVEIPRRVALGEFPVTE